jgi:ABC-type dipeptide/oligopeptide/nickel transport system permease subunit
VIIGALSAGLFGFGGGADNPFWFYAAAILQFPASLLFTTVLAVLKTKSANEILGLEVACAVVAILQFLLLAVGIKKIRDYWLS